MGKTKDISFIMCLRNLDGEEARIKLDWTQKSPDINSPALVTVYRYSRGQGVTKNHYH